MIDERAPLLLGSASPRRAEILRSLRIPFIVKSAEVDETVRAGEPADAYLERVIAAKMAAGRRALDEMGPRAAAVSGSGGSAEQAAPAVLVADTAVLLDGLILGKPGDCAEAERMLRLLSGRTHEVCTRFAISAVNGGAIARTVASRVTFRMLAEDEIVGYAASGEGLDKAGAYAVQGLGSFAVERIEGSYSNVVGLPACELVVALRGMGLLDRYPR